MEWGINLMVKKTIKLKNIIILILFIFSLSIIFLISFISNILIKNNFNNYIKNRIDSEKSTVLKSISYTYLHNKWNVKEIERIGVEALEEGLIIKVVDNNGNIIWDANNNYNDMCQFMLNEMNDNFKSISPSSQGEYVEEYYDLDVNGVDIGYVEIGYYGPIYYNNSDIMFFNGLNISLIIVTIVAIVLSVVMGVLISSNISKPVLEIANSTKEIINGKYKKRLSNNNKVKEINEMIVSINELADSLEMDEKMRKNLTRDISHELRTPLTTIQLQIEALIDGVWEASEERLIGIQYEIIRLTRLVESLEKLLEYDNDSLKLKKEEIDICQLINGVIINFEKQVFDKGIELKTNLKKLTLNIDKDKIIQAIINLISNSIKYTPKGGTLTISCYSDNKNGYISIKDTGVGISEEHIKHIFKRFYRVDSSRTRKTGGSGIGLSIAQSIINAHGGEIIVKSQVNKGSEFIMIIPLEK